MKQEKAKVLIADDEQAITSGLSAILEDEGYTVDIANDGQKALERLSAERYGVVLADLKMPKLDGIALLRELREQRIATEFIMITGQGSTELAIEAIKQGAADYIEKPLNAERLNKLKAQIPKLLDQFALQEKNRELSAKLEGLTHYGELTGTVRGHAQCVPGDRRRGAVERERTDPRRVGHGQRARRPGHAFQE